MISKRQLRIDRLTLAAFLPVALALVLWFFHLAGADPVPASHYRVQAIVPTSDALAPHADVRFDGVKVGKVAKIAGYGANGRRSLLLLDIDRDHAPIFRNARVRIRLRTVVGENYVELNPGTPSAGALPEGGTLGVDHAAEYVALDDVFSTLDAPTRRHLRGQMAEFAAALGDRGADMNRALGGAASLTADGSPVVSVLAAHRHDVAALIDYLGAVMRALGERRHDIALLAKHSRTALAALAARDQLVRSSLRALPGTLRQARTTAARLAGFSATSTAVLHNLRVSMQGLDPVVSDLRPAAASARKTVAALEPFARRATPLTSALTGFSRAGTTALPALHQLLREYNPLGAYFAQHTAETGAFFSNMRSLTNARDATGHLARINVVVTPSMIAAFTPEMRRMYDRLRSIGVAQAAIGPHYVNPYPPPGRIAAPGAFEGEYPRLRPEP
jgi:phospholipid/cholesterol/gamma-HCH transport system substrate-binding protein